MSALHSVYRKPSRLALSVAAVTATVTMGTAAGVVVATSGGHAARPRSVLTAAQSPSARSGHGQPQILSLPSSSAGRQIVTSGLPDGLVRAHALAVDASRAAAARAAAKRAAERRAAERRAAAKRAAERRAAARRAAAQAAARRAAQAAAARRAAQAAAARRAAQAAAPSGSPQQIALGMLGRFGWSSSQFGCLQSLWNRESGWNPTASNPTSGAYGIPQALPGSKMASAGSDWQTNPATQIRWGLGYIQQVYGSPCGAWSHELSYGWY